MHGVDPYYWGPSAWRFYHSVAYAYSINPTVDEKNAAKKFIISLSKLLPCFKCRNHYSVNLSDFDLDDVVLNRYNFMKFVIDLHNRVNISLHKPVITGDVETITESIIFQSNDMVIMVLVMIIVVLTGVILLHVF